MGFDLARVRGQYTSIGGQWTYLNAQVAPQTPERVAAAAARGFRDANVAQPIGFGAGQHARGAQRGDLFASEYLRAAKLAVADLTGTTADAVVLGHSETVLRSELDCAMRAMMRRSSSLVGIQPENAIGTITPRQVAGMLAADTRFVALPTAHPAIGAINPVPEIVDRIRNHCRAWILAEATPVVGVRPITFDALGVDIISVDLAALGAGPIAALAFRDTTMFKRIDVTCFSEQVSAGHAAAAAVAIDHLAELAVPSAGTRRASRRTRLEQSIEAIAGHLGDLYTYLVDALHTVPNATILGTARGVHSLEDIDRAPVASLYLRDIPAEVVHDRLLEQGIMTGLADPQDPVLRQLGMRPELGALTIGLAPYNNTAEVDHLTRVIASFAAY